jgi:uncharacterized protein
LAGQGGGSRRSEENRSGRAFEHAPLSGHVSAGATVRAATDHAINACGRLAGVELPTFANTEASFPELEERVAKTIEFIKAIKSEQINGSEDKEITMKFASGERKFSGQSLLLNFCLPNFYFHATTAYDILRQSGVELGKRDFMGTPPQL